VGVANEELDESYLESLGSALADELSFTFDFEQLDSKDLGTVHRSPVWPECWSKSMFQRPIASRHRAGAFKCGCS